MQRGPNEEKGERLWDSGVTHKLREARARVITLHVFLPETKHLEAHGDQACRIQPAVHDIEPHPVRTSKFRKRFFGGYRGVVGKQNSGGNCGRGKNSVEVKQDLLQ